MELAISASLLLLMPLVTHLFLHLPLYIISPLCFFCSNYYKVLSANSPLLLMFLLLLLLLSLVLLTSIVTLKPVWQ